MNTREYIARFIYNVSVCTIQFRINTLFHLKNKNLYAHEVFFSLQGSYKKRIGTKIILSSLGWSQSEPEKAARL